VSWGWRKEAIAATDAAGRFALTGLPPQPTYGLHVHPPEKSPLLSREIDVPDSPGLQPMSAEVTLARGIILTGRVIDERTGRGVQSEVWFAPLPGNKWFAKPGYDSYRRAQSGPGTDPEGNIRALAIPGPGVLVARGFGELLDGQYVRPYLPATFTEEDRKHVHLASDGDEQYFVTAGGTPVILHGEHAVKYLDLAEDAGTVTVNLMLRRGKTAKLTIQDPEGRPLTGAVVSGVGASWDVTNPLTAAECPVYALDPAKPRTVVVSHPGRNLGGQVVVRGDEAGPVVVKLRPAGAVTGRFLDADGQPVAGADVFLSFPSRPAGAFVQRQRPSIRTDADGRFQLEGMVPGVTFAVQRIRKGNAALAPKPETGLKEVGSGATLDLGDIRVEPFRPG
jgi:protocatechuate 3,4-dioxygenase beta subunit